MANIILRLTAASGLQGIAGAAMITSHGFDRSVGETLRYLLPDVIGRTPARARGALAPAAQPRHAAGAAGAFADRHRALGHGRQARGPAALPAARRRARQECCPMPPRRCSPTTQAYVDYCAARQEEGFKAVKFHCWCVPARDLPMCEAVHRRYGGQGPGADARCRAALRRAIRRSWRRGGSASSASAGSRRRCSIPTSRAIARSGARPRVPIIAAGNTWLDLADVGAGVAHRAGALPGSTPRSAAASRRSARSWRSPKPTAPRRDPVLGLYADPGGQPACHARLSNCTYFEQPVPYPAFEYGAHDVIRTDARRLCRMPAGPGLGIGIDWPAIEAATIDRLEVRAEQ